MKKVKTIILAIGLAFIAGCGTDDSKSNGGELVSCRFRDVTICNESQPCMANAFSVSENSKCAEFIITELEEANISVTAVEGECYVKPPRNENNKGIFTFETCPNGYVQKCKFRIKTVFYNTYFYGEEYKDKTCNELGFWPGDDAEDAPD